MSLARPMALFNGGEEAGRLAPGLRVARSPGPRMRSQSCVMVGATRFERATLCSQSRCATRLRYAPKGEILPACAEQPIEQRGVEVTVDEIGQQFEAVVERGRVRAPHRAQQRRRFEQAVR